MWEMNITSVGDEYYKRGVNTSTGMMGDKCGQHNNTGIFCVAITTKNKQTSKFKYCNKHKQQNSSYVWIITICGKQCSNEANGKDVMCTQHINLKKRKSIIASSTWWKEMQRM